jgi:hypothetical protein
MPALIIANRIITWGLGTDPFLSSPGLPIHGLGGPSTGGAVTASQSPTTISFPASYLSFFTNAPRDGSFFDEGPQRTARAKGFATGSMDTSNIDAYRQGVELTLIKHYDKGIVKIHAGEQGHIVKQNTFGMDAPTFAGIRFSDLDRIDGISLMKANLLTSTRFKKLLALPNTVIDDGIRIETVGNGTLEPLTIRRSKPISSSLAPSDPHPVLGAIMGGNLDRNGTKAADRVLTVDFFDPFHVQRPYVDTFYRVYASASLGGAFSTKKAATAAFFDVTLSRGTLPILIVGPQSAKARSVNADEAAMNAALSLMTGSTDNYVPYNKVSATSGWTFDTTAGIGTDSLAFGGQVH